MGIVSIQPADPDSQPEWEETGDEPRRPHLQKNMPTPVPSPHRWLQVTGLPKEGEAEGLPCHGRPGASGDGLHINAVNSSSSNPVRKLAAATAFTSSKCIWPWLPGLTKQAPTLSCTPGSAKGPINSLFCQAIATSLFFGSGIGGLLSGSVNQ